MALHSMENRVYEVELDLDEKPKDRAEGFLIAKFYRPGRWRPEQIEDEHQFLQDLEGNEIPVVAPRAFVDGETLHKLPDADIYYAVFPKIGGRSPYELDDDQLARAGRLLARLHGVGATRQAQHRIPLTPQTYGLDNLRHLIDAKILPDEIRPQYQPLVEQLCAHVEPWFEGARWQRIHGDCHLGNLLQGQAGLFFVDFDDMVRGPCAQDVWLLLPGRDEEAIRQRTVLLDAYETMRPFDHGELRLIEPLRALRFVHFSAWIGRRWQDPAFPRAFPQFGTPRYWQEQVQDLREQWQIIQES